ncbi:MAG: biotin--[acetyl-CoA-carboxylase] ligase [Calditrichaeota bacterium]|nr:biotin--[acetyl-CoA-carboxylase] ligase [Calditrichota bacterium]
MEDHWQIPVDGSHSINIFYYPSIDSTNTRAVSLAREGKPEWTVVFASEQTAGKGRINRIWWSPPDLGLWFSVILRPKIRVKSVNLLNLALALTIRSFIEKLVTEKLPENPPRIQVKWPNDILLEGKKICGILLESEITPQKIKYIVAGIGLNVNQGRDDFPADLSSRAISIKMVTGENYVIFRLLTQFLKYFYNDFNQLREKKFNYIVSEYENHLAFTNQYVEIHLQDKVIAGVQKGIDPAGNLVLSGSQGDVIVTAGDLWGFTEGNSDDSDH